MSSSSRYWWQHGLVRGLLFLILAGIAVWLVADNLFFFFRDNFATHYPVKRVTARILSEGSLPLWDPFSGGGQPLAGNPNYLTFYPTTFLYLVLAEHVAFSAHFSLHLLIGVAGMWALLRHYRIDPILSILGALSYGMAGPVLSTTSFYNLVVVAGLSPWAVLFAERLRTEGERRVVNAFRLGGTIGLIGLAGELVSAGALGLALAAVLLRGREKRSVIRPAIAAAALALVIIAPMFLAWLEIAPHTERSVFGTPPGETLLASLSFARLGEIVTGPPGWTIASASPREVRDRSGGADDDVLLVSVFVGVLLLPAIFTLFREARLRFWSILFIVSIFLALGRHNPLVELALLATGGIPVRYPQKLLLLAALSGLVAMFCFLDRVRRERVPYVPVLAGIAVLLVAFIANRERIDGSPAIPISILLLQIAALGLLLMHRDGRMNAVPSAFLQLVALIIAVPVTVAVDDAEFWSEPPLTADIVRGGAIVNRGAIEEERLSPVPLYRTRARRLEAMFGAGFGIAYPLARSGEGMYSWLSRVERDRYAVAEAHRSTYERIAGVTHLIGPGETVIRSSSGESFRLPVSIEQRSRLPGYRSPESVVAVSSLDEAVRTIERDDFDPSREAVVRGNVGQVDGPLEVEPVKLGTQRHLVELNATSGGIVVTPLTWFPSWRVSTGGGELETFPAYVDQLAFLAPAGNYHVSIEFGRWRKEIGALWILSIVTMMICFVWGAFGSSGYGSTGEG